MQNIVKKYRPRAIITKTTHDGKPLILQIKGDRYVLDDTQRRKERKAHDLAMIERDLLLKLLVRKGVVIPKRPHELKLEDLRLMLIG